MPSLVKLSLDIQPERRPWTERALLQAPAEENGPGTETRRSSAEEGSVLELQPVQRHIPLGSSVIKSLWPTGTATKSWEGQGQVGAAQPCGEPYQEHTTRQENFPVQEAFTWEIPRLAVLVITTAAMMKTLNSDDSGSLMSGLTVNEQQFLSQLP